MAYAMPTKEDQLLERVAELMRQMQAKRDGDSNPGLKREDVNPGMRNFEQQYAAYHAKKNAKKSVDKPHVIFFLIDDLGYNDVSWHNSEVLTPYIDSLVAEGIILDMDYSQSACSPSRGSLMTGKYPFHIGMQHNVIQWSSPECVSHDESLLSEKLQSAGYSTHMLGKWHLGFCNEDCLPTRRGFDTFFGFYQGFIDHYTHMTGENMEGYDWRDGDDVRQDLQGQYAGTLLSDRAVDIINNYDDPSTPMFMYFAHSGVHTPNESPDDYKNLYPGLDDHRATYLGQVSQVDDTIEAVVTALKNKGMYDNSIIIFQSDNGAEAAAGSNYPLRGSKTSTYEGGVRVPAFFHSPLASAKGVTSNELFHISDWHTTILSMAGLDTSGLDGVDQTDLLLNNGASARDTIVNQIDSLDSSIFGTFTLRQGDYKIIVGFPGLMDGWENDATYPLGFTHSVGYMMSGQDTFKRSQARTYKRSEYDYDWDAIDAYCNDASVKANIQVYNIADDPEERTNLADSADMASFIDDMNSLISSLVGEEVMPDLSVEAPSPAGAAENFGNVWTTGWC